MRKIPLLLISGVIGLLPLSPAVQAADYVIDTKGMHASIQFKIAHLGYSWLLGRFNEFHGRFSFDEQNPSASKVEVVINTASLDSNHAERDKHLRSKDFLEVKRFPQARFASTSYEVNSAGKGILKGTLTLHGVTKPIAIKVQQVGAGPDPWGGFRRGFEGHTRIALKDFGINFDLGPASKELELQLYIEGIRR